MFIWRSTLEFWCRHVSIARGIGRGWALEIETFRAHPFQWLSYGFARIIKSKHHINNRYIGNFMYMSFRVQRILSPHCRYVWSDGVGAGHSYCTFEPLPDGYLTQITSTQLSSHCRSQRWQQWFRQQHFQLFLYSVLCIGIFYSLFCEFYVHDFFILWNYPFQIEWPYCGDDLSTSISIIHQNQFIFFYLTFSVVTLPSYICLGLSICFPEFTSCVILFIPKSAIILIFYR